MYGQKSISQSLLDAVNSAMSEDIHPQAQMLLKHIKPEHHAVYKPFLAKKVFNGSFKDKTDVLHAAKQAGHLVSENIEEIIEGFKELMQDVKDRAGPQPKGHIGQKAGTRYGGAGQKDDEREKETERLDNKKKDMKKESFGDFKDRLIESLKGKQKNIDKNKNNKIDAHDFEILRAQKEEVEELDEISTKTLASAAKSASDPDSDYYYGKSHDSQKFADHAKKTKDARSAAAVQGAADAKSHYPRPGHTVGGNDTLADRTKSRITSAGKANKQDMKTLKGKIRQSYQNEDVEDVNEVMDQPNYKNSIQSRQAAADKDFKDRQARLAAAGKETAKDPVRLKRLSSIPGYTAAMDLAKKTTKEEVELDEAGEVKAPTKGLTVDTLAGPKKAPKGFEKDNEHTSAKVPLKTESKRPESDTVPFVTDAVQSPKERLRAALGRVKKEMSSGY